MKISARNQFQGKVVSVETGAVNAKVTVDIGGGLTMTSIISMEAVKELEIVPGGTVTAIVKASSVLLGV